MMELKFTVSQTAAAMGMEPARMWALLGQWGVQPREDSLTLEQIQQLRQLLSEHQDEHQLRAQNSLERVVQRYTLLADTCSLLHQQFPLLAERLTPLLRQSCRTLIVPSGVLAELRSLPLKKPELTERVRTALPCLAKLQNQGLLRIYGEREGSFGDQQLLSSATRLMTSSPLLVITQDRDLSCDLLRLNQLDSMREKQPVAVSRINRYGYLSRFQPLEQRPADSRAEGAAAFAGADGDLRRREGAPLGGLSWTERRADPAPAEQPLPRHRELDRQPAPKDAGEDAPAGSWRLLWSGFTRCLREEFAAQRAASAAEKSCPEPADRQEQPAPGEDTAAADPTQVYQRVCCVECGQSFDITVGESLYFHQHHLNLPRRCPACRKQRRMERAGLTLGA